MGEGLSDRQTQILKALITEYIETAEPVGSLALDKKYELGVSPATIRSEMANLTEGGFLRQPHTSSGRIPTPSAMKFYINQLMDEKQVSLAEEVRHKEGVRGHRRDLDGLMDYVTRSLAVKTNCMALATTEEGRIWSHGIANIFASPEFYNYQVCRSLFEIIDERRTLRELFFEKLAGVSAVEVLFGEELGWEFFDTIGVVAARFRHGETNGAIGVIGPYRLNYASVIPALRNMGQLITSLSES